MTKQWKNSNGEVAIELTIDDVEGIVLKLNSEENIKHGKEVEEMQTLNMYPPRDEEKISGVADESGSWTTYEIVPGKNWEFAQKDIVSTCDFWKGSFNPME